MQQENDSLKAQIRTYEYETSGDTVSLPEPADMPVADKSDVLIGIHSLTLQWISWQNPGTVEILAPVEGEWHPIKGEQRIGQDYLTINGRIRKLNNRELEFDGTIETKVSILNKNKPCIRKGVQLFKATGNRQYWRMQNMVNCEGGRTVDYVDIYF